MKARVVAFDGDEMNIHVPQSLEAQAELRMLSAAKYNLISSQSVSKPSVAIVQDSLLGAFQMTNGVKPITRDEYFNVAMKTGMSSQDILDRIKHIKQVLKEKGKKPDAFNGRGLISLVFPTNFNYEKKNNANQKEPVVKIYKGVLYEGTLNKANLGATTNSLIKIMAKEYDLDAASTFIDNVHFITNNWLLIYGFSVGIEDCMIPEHDGENKKQQIQDVIQKYYIEAEGIKTTTNHKNIMEIRVTATLNKAKDIGMRIAKQGFSADNNFVQTVTSGSKGDFTNIAQITGLLGQQNLVGARVKPVLNNGKRTLPHYPMGDLPVELEYESRGFIASSFSKGLNPREFFFHAMSGREGVTDTAMGTANSGYMQRRIIKLTEDIKIQHDRTVRDNTGKIYQMVYGDVNVDPTQSVSVNGNEEICDISRMIEKLNMEYEEEHGIERKE